MSDYKRFDDATWDRFLKFIDVETERMSITDVDDELARRGIDVAPAVQRVLEAARAARAREALAQARRDRPRALERIGKVVDTITGSLRDRIDELIRGRLAGTTQAAFFRKLERAATEQDLRTLLEDIERLSALDEDDPDGTQ